MSRARDLADGTFSGAFEVDSPTLVVDAANNRVGVGTSSPSAKLQVGTTINSTALILDGTNYSAGEQQVRVDFTSGGSTHVYSRIANETGAAAWSGELVFATNPGTSQGSAVVERMRIDLAGRVTMPYQPAFRAIVNNDSYLTTSPVPFGTTTLNVGNHFNTGTYTFTAPIAGVYFMFVGMYLRTDNNEDAYPQLRINGVSVQYSYLYNLGNGGRIDNTVALGRIISLSANDTVSVAFGGSGEYFGGASESHFSGYLIG